MTTGFGGAAARAAAVPALVGTTSFVLFEGGSNEAAEDPVLAPAAAPFAVIGLPPSGWFSPELIITEITPSLTPACFNVTSPCTDVSNFVLDCLILAMTMSSEIL